MCAVIPLHKPTCYTGKPKPGRLGACSSSHSKFRSHVRVGTQLSWTLGHWPSSADNLIWPFTKNLDTEWPQALAAAPILSSNPTCGWLPSLPTRQNNCLKLYSNNSFCIVSVESLGRPRGTLPTSSLVVTLPQWGAFPFPVPASWMPCLSLPWTWGKSSLSYHSQ